MMAEFRPVPAPRKQLTSPPVPPKPTSTRSKLINNLQNNTDIPVPIPRKNIDNKDTFEGSSEVSRHECVSEDLEEPEYEPISEAWNSIYNTLDYNLPPSVHPRPTNSTSEHFSAVLYEILQENYSASKNNDKPSNDSNNIKNDKKMRQNTQEETKKKLTVPVLPIVKESNAKDLQNWEETRNSIYNTLDHNSPPSVPPRPTNITTDRFSAVLNDIYQASKCIDKHSNDSDNNKNDNDTRQNTKDETIKKLIVPVLPNVTQSDVKDLQHSDLELKELLKKFLDSEQQYIKKLENALEICREMQLTGAPESITSKFFGSLKEIHALHKNIFYKDLQQNINNPNQMIFCFVKHASRFSVYIEKQWLTPKETDLSDFELLLLNERNLKECIYMTKERVLEYIKTLAHLKSFIQFNFKGYNDYLLVTNSAIAVVENICYQLEVTEKLQNIGNIRNRFKECGQVYLNNTFRISIDGGQRNKYHVYFCENLILFSTMEEDGTSSQYFDDIAVSECYYCTVKKKPAIFELGIKNKKRYILKADSQSTRDKWCEKLNEVLGPQVTHI